MLEKKFKEWTPEIQRETYIEYMTNHDIEDSVEVTQTNERVMEYLGKITNVDKAEIEDMLSYLSFERERQGFVNGFSYAMNLQKGVVV